MMRTADLNNHSRPMRSDRPLLEGRPCLAKWLWELLSAPTVGSADNTLTDHEGHAVRYERGLGSTEYMIPKLLTQREAKDFW
jgi:hypothetical protein